MQVGPGEQAPMCLYAVREAQGEVRVAGGHGVSIWVWVQGREGEGEGSGDVAQGLQMMRCSPAGLFFL